MAYIVVEPLNDFNEQRGPVLHVLSEDLQQVTLVIKVHQNPQFLKLHASE